MLRTQLTFFAGLAVLLVVGCAVETDSDYGSSSAALVPGADQCTPHETPIFAGRHHEAGRVSLSSDGEAVSVELSGTDGWRFVAYHIYVGTEPVPTNRAGAPRPGHFPYKEWFLPPTDSATLTLSLDDLGAACGATLNVAVHVVAVKRQGRRWLVETGWADGPNEFGSSRRGRWFSRGWGSWFDWDICCAGEGCVMPKYIWRDHADWWGLSSLSMGGHDYHEDELMTLLWTPGWGDASIDLAHQVIGAKLNIANGAVPSPQVVAALSEAATWFDSQADPDGTLPYGIYSIHEGHAEGMSLATELQDWNEGNSELPLCQWW